MNATTIITNGTPPPNAEITPTHVNIKIAIYDFRFRWQNQMQMVIDNR